MINWYKLSFNLLTNTAKVMAMASQPKLFTKNEDIRESSAYFDNIYWQFNELS